jgi:ADP-ribose pyrophosphatase YjhB (NUDIX family)
MYTNDYNFVGANAIKIIVQNGEGKVLLTQEPENFAWMPLHWGLPGGKATNTESLMETFDRKCIVDIGQKLKMEGIFRIYELLQDKRTIFMYIVVAITGSNDVSGEAKSYKWVDLADIEKMDIVEFTEYYNKNMLTEFLSQKSQLVNQNLIHTFPYYSMNVDSEYQRWLESGKQEK